MVSTVSPADHEVPVIVPSSELPSGLMKEMISVPASKVAGFMGTLKVRIRLETWPMTAGTAGADAVFTWGRSLKISKRPLSAKSVLPLRFSSTRIM